VLRYREIPPAPALRPHLSTFWLLELDGSDPTPQRIVPDGRAELILNRAEPYQAFANGQWHRQPQCFLAGQIDGPLLLRPKGPTKILGIGFHPHGTICRQCTAHYWNGSQPTLTCASANRASAATASQFRKF